jgi:hypothetical protein
MFNIDMLNRDSWPPLKEKINLPVDKNIIDLKNE